MKIREIRVQNFRNFGPELRSVKFYDEATGLVRPISVLVGSNGCGKTTLLETMMGVLAPLDNKNLRLPEFNKNFVWLFARKDAVAVCEIEPGPEGVFANVGEPLWLGVLPKARAEHMRGVLWYTDDAGHYISKPDPPALVAARVCVDEMTHGETALRDGALYLPHNRWIEHVQGGAIQAPSVERPWLYRFDAESKWEGSLSQLWVWQNYLDLEQGREGRPNLAPFVETIEDILGRGRKVKIEKGRVRIERPDLGDSVVPQALPSGEQQILTIFGEIIRMLRPGAVILIDEVEISLHPALQRAVLFHLRRLAAKYDLQIIMTTHSMEIVSAVAPEEVINLDDMAIVEQARASEGA